MALQLDFLITTHAASPEAVSKPYAAIQSNYYRAIGQVRPPRTEFPASGQAFTST
jgi:hypothetical protein